MAKMDFLKNCGVYLEMNGVRMLIDALNRSYGGYDYISNDEFDSFFGIGAKYADVDFLIYSHYHPDHWSRELTNRYMQIFPHCRLLGPQRFVTLKYDEELLKETGIYVYGMGFPHSGEEYKGALHQALLIGNGDKNIFFGSDADFTDEALAAEIARTAEMAGAEKIDVAFLNPLFIANAKGIKVLRSVNAEKTYIYHIPNENTADPLSVRRMAKYSYDRLFSDDDSVELLLNNMRELGF